MDKLLAYINEKATSYWNESADEKIDSFPESIVDFVVEYAISYCHFPASYSRDDIADVLDSHKSKLAMACVDVYAKAGIEGEKNHSENGITRSYENAWISNGLLCTLPNYVNYIV